MIALIDADLVAYRCAAGTENETEDVAVFRTNELMRLLLHSTNSTEHAAYLSGGGSYRKELDPLYKANRTQEKPKWLETLKEHLVLFWGASVTEDIEADDAIGIASQQCLFDDRACTIISLDKDFLQLPGYHYQWEFSGTTVKKLANGEREYKKWTKPAQHIYVTPMDGLRWFYQQLLIGDVSDNVVGVEGIGKVKAAKLINSFDNELDMYNAVVDLYDDKERFEKNAQLLWILKQSTQPTEVLSHFHSLLKPDEEVKS